MTSRRTPLLHLLVTIFMLGSTRNSKAMEVSPVFQATVLAGAAIGVAGIALYFAANLIDSCTLTETQREQIKVLKNGAHGLDRTAWLLENSASTPNKAHIAELEQKIEKSLADLEKMLDPAIRNRVPHKLHAAALETHRATINLQQKLDIIKRSV